MHRKPVRQQPRRRRSNAGAKVSSGTSQIPGGWPGPPNQRKLSAAAPCLASSRVRSISILPLEPDSTRTAQRGCSPLGSASSPSGSGGTSVTVGLELVQDEADDGSRGRGVERIAQGGVSVAGDDALHDSGKRRPVWVSRESS